MDGNGGCCIARWTDGGYDKSKMDMIMLKYRPIAPKPVADNGSLVTTSEGSNNCPRDGRHAKPAARGRRKNNATKNNGKRRKSSSPDNDNYQANEFPHDLDDQDDRNKGSSVTLLPLFPESPDLMSSTNNNNQANNMTTTWLNFDTNNNYYYNDSTPG